MKKLHIISISILLAFGLMFTSCENDFLDKNPLDQISNQTFWESEKDVQMALAGCYDRLRGSSLNHQRGYLDGLSEVAYVHWGLLNISDISRGNVSSTTSGMPNVVYGGCYRGIASSNYFMNNVDKATTVAESKRNAYKGEARFLRALFYFDLVNFFGGVPLYKESPIDAKSSKIAKSSKEDVLAFIHEDLDFAIANLPDNAYTNGHAVKGSAMGIKTRVLLYEEKWTEAATLAQQIMSSGKFSIFNDYESMFLTKGQINNPEIMFSCDYLSPDAPLPYGYNLEYTQSVFLRRNLMDAYECTDGKTISESSLYDPADPYANRDPRFYFTIRNPVGTDWPGYSPYTFIDPTGVQNRKYVDPTIPGDYSNAYRNDWNTVLLRYADVLLMYAEAKNEVSGPDASVYAAINEVRARPGVDMPDVDETKYSTKDLVRDYIRHERLVEFPLEGIRYFDLKRWNIAHILLPTVKDADGNNLVFEQKHYLWPFSQNELDANPQLVQNPGY